MITDRGAVTDHRWRRQAWAPTLLVGIALYELLRVGYLDTHNPNLVPGLLLPGAMTGPTPFVLFVASRQWRVDVGAMPVLGIALVGGVIGVVPSSVLEYHTSSRWAGCRRSGSRSSKKRASCCRHWRCS
jgi:hypothetical protein